MRKCLFPISLSCAALLAGCYNPDKESSTYYQSSYQPSSGMASTESTYTETQRTYTDTQRQDQGATGSQTQQTTGSGEIQTERMVIPLHEEQVQVGKRTVESGTVRLRKQIVTETVNQPVQIRKETIVVDREPAGGTSTSQSFQSGSSQSQQLQQSQSQSGSFHQPFGEGEIVVRLHSEEPVIEKRVVPAGNIVVETRANTEQMNVQQQIRREKIDVDKGNAQNVIISDRLNQSGSEASGSSQTQPQRYQESTTTTTTTVPSTTTRTNATELEYRAPVTTREYEPFPRPQPDGRETFPELKKDPERERP